MIICWNNIENGFVTKDGNFRRNRETFHIKVCPNCGEEFLGYRKKIDGLNCCSNRCSQMYKFSKQQNIWFNTDYEIEKKRCLMCGEVKKLSEFYNNSRNSTTVSSNCISCCIEKSKEYVDYRKEYNSKNSKKIREYRNQHALYDTFYQKLEPIEECRRAPDNETLLEVRCTYCGDWLKPNNTNVQHRISCIEGKTGTRGEKRFYCSAKCKKSCPIYGKVGSYLTRMFSKNEEYVRVRNYSKAREVQPELRQMRFKIDDWTCQKCRKHKDKLSVPLHCHHIEGIHWEPIESADVDKVITLCENCHKEVHQQQDCKYSDMQCK